MASLQYPQLITVNKERNTLDFTKCKISINKITKKLNVIPEKSGSKKTALSFKRQFIYSRNILCALNSSNDSNCYFLILQSEETCKKIFNVVQKTNEEITAHIYYRYRKYIEKLVRNANIKAKLVKNVYEIDVDENNELVLRSGNNNKRPITDKDSNNESSDDEYAPENPKNGDFVLMKETYESPSFEKVTAERKGVFKARLLIFPNNDKTFHFEYYYEKKLEFYRCCGGCSMKANIIKNDENEYVQISATSKKHYCKLRKYDAGKYTVDASTRIVESQNYKIINYTQKGISTSKLFIFDPANKKLCRGFYWEKDNKYYLCMGCNAKSQRIFAKVCKNMDGIEYLMLSKNEHVCEMKEYNLDKYKDDIVVKKPMFQHVEHTVAGVTRKYILIFIDKERKYYYKFGYEHGYLPICTRCSSKNFHIPAYILTDDNGDEYLSVRDKKHICEPMEYKSSDYEKNHIIRRPGYKLVKRYWKTKYIEKLVTFDSNDNTLCREYTPQPCKANKKYICNECHHKHGICVTAWIINHEKEDEYVEISKTEHKCWLIKFEDPNSTIIKLPYFKLIKSVKKGLSKKPKNHLIIYSSLEKEKLCYRYFSEKEHFSCLECKCKVGKTISAKVFKNENGEDFVQLGENQHFCKPQPEKAVLKKLSSFYTILN